MEVLMIRLDVFEEQHGDLLDFWKHIIHFLSEDNVEMFICAFTNEVMGEEISPVLFALSESDFDQSVTMLDLEEAQTEIKEKLKMPKLLDILKARIEVARGTSDMSPEKKRLLEEYCEIEESKKVIIHDIEKLNIIIKKEMQKFWNHIDTLTIDSYKRMLYDITGSDVFTEAFMKELLRYGIVRDLSIAKRDRDYDGIINITNALDECIGDWVRDIEQLVGASQ